MIGHTPQVALFDQLYEFYVDGIECLRFSPTIKPYFCDDTIDKNVPFMQEINSTLNEIHFINELLIIQNVWFEDTLPSGKEFGMLMNRIERFLRGKMTKYQPFIVQSITVLLMRYFGMNLQRISEMIMSRKQVYLAKKYACFILKFSSTIGGVSEVLYLAMFYYTNGQYEQSLKCTRRARPYPVIVKSSNAMMRKSSIQDIYLYNAFAIFSELVIEQTANKEIYSESSRLHIPYEVMFHMLLILNYHKLGDTVKSQQSLQDLHTLVTSSKCLDVATVYRDIYPNFFLKLDLFNPPLTYEMYADISWQILGICQHICGDYLGALNSYQYSLAVKSFNGFHRATYLRILLSLFALTQNRSTYLDC